MPSYSMSTSAIGPGGTASDDDSVVVGVEFYVTQPCTLDAIRWWQAEAGANLSARKGGIYVAAGNTSALNETIQRAPGPGEIRQWHDLPFVTPFPLEVNTRYIATVLHPQGRYSMTPSYYGGFQFKETNGPLVIPGMDSSEGPGQNCFVYAQTMARPLGSFNDSKYWLDVVVTTTGSGGGSVDTFTSPIRLFGTTYAAGDALPAMSPSVKRSLLKRGRIAPATLTVQRPFKAGGVSYAVGAAWPAGADPKVLRRLLRSRKIG